MDLQFALQQRTKVEAFQRKHRIGLLTLLFTDLVGSTKLKQELGDSAAVSWIQSHHSVVREILGCFKEGEEIETAGDSFFIVFAKPSDAVRFALLLQSRLRGLPEPEGRLLRDRIGLHIGEVVIEERPDSPKPKDLYGLQIDICARVTSLAEGDQILMTRSVFDNARQVLKGQEIGRLNQLKGLQWLNHGSYVMKGVEEPLEVCEVGEAGAAALKAPSDSEKVHRYVSPDAELVLGWRPAAGQRVPGTPWSLTEKLGEGGFGEVWLGRHARLKELRVFKFCFRADRVRALKREMTLFRVLKKRVGEHPNIMRLLEVNLDKPPFYLEEEYVPGRDLRTWCEGQGGIGNVPMEARLELIAQAAEALAEAHEAGIIHRDVKPGNILIADLRFAICDLKRTVPSEVVAAGDAVSVGKEQVTARDQSQIANLKSQISVKLTDFGIGQVVSAEHLAGVTATGMTETILRPTSSSQSGTHAYMAPELLMGRAASAQSDIYSLGMVLYQLLVCDFARPVTTDWAQDVRDPLLQEDLHRCFAGKPEERFASARDLAKSLRSLPERRNKRAAVSKEAFESGTAKIASLAVLPFVNMSEEAENEFLSDGIAEDLITALSRVPGLRVPGRTSCFAFKGKTEDLRKVGQMLNVETVLEGSVRKSGNRLRITAQLINVADGFHLWSERYDRELADVFAIQDEITQAIMGALMPKLAAQQPRILIKPHTGNIQAYEFCLRGRYHWQRLSPEGFDVGIRCYGQALQFDPNYAPAHAGMGHLLRLLCYFGAVPAHQGMPKAKAAARRALELDETLAEAHTTLADILYFYDWDWSGAEKEFLRALELNPQNCEAHSWYGFFLWARLRHEQALRELHAAAELDPMSPEPMWILTWPLLSLGRYGEVLDVGRRLLAMDPGSWINHTVMAHARTAQGELVDAVHHWERAAAMEGGPVAVACLCLGYGMAGESGEARRVLEQLKQMTQQRYVQPVWLAIAHSAVGENDQAMVCIRRAIEEHDSALVHLRGFSSWPHVMSLNQPAWHAWLDLLEKAGI